MTVPKRQLLHEMRNQLARLAARADLMRVQPEQSSGRHAPHVASIAREVAEALAALEAQLSDEQPGPPRDTSPLTPTTNTVEVDAPRRAEGTSGGDIEGFSETLPSPGVVAGMMTRAEGPGGKAPDRAALSKRKGRHELAPGDVLGPLRMIRRLGRGGMGTVMLARDVQLGRLVAVKLVDHESWTGEVAREAFLHEARAMARVHHPNVVTIHAFGEHRGSPYFVMEYVPGTTLERLLSVRGRPLPFDQAISVVDQVCRGLEAIHRAGTLHCDVKPANVLIGSPFRVAVADLGLARTIKDGQGTYGGTPGFVAPELLADASTPATERVDVYAVGALTYELLTGFSAFPTDSVRDTFELQVEGDQPPPSSRADIPVIFDDIIQRALSVSPSERQPSAEAFRRELLAACDTLPRTYADTIVHVVDDDVELLSHTAVLTERALPDATVRTFSEPRAALHAAQSETPDITVVDLEMPDINGMELTAALKSGSDGQRVQVVMLTGVGSARDWEVLHHLGASGFLLKPVDEAELSSLLRRLAAADL